LHEDITAAARSDAKVLITGESGTGKEVTARLVHARSARHARPLVPINCAGVPESLLESELFGFRRGSFTGADRDKPGLLETAHRGTAFLDEVAEMSLRMQGLLLRFLETGELLRIGSVDAPERADVRIIAATNRDLTDGVTTQAFRLDLFYRLNVIHIKLPPLRERREDIRHFIEHFLSTLCDDCGIRRPDLTPDAIEALERYHWPGNVRQLKNVLERTVVARTGAPVRAADLPAEILEASPAAAAQAAPAREQVLLDRMLIDHESFWSVVYGLFLTRDLTRDDLRSIVGQGLQRADGNIARLVELFNMPPDDQRRFVNFLKKHQCQVGVLPVQAPVSDAAAHRELRHVAGN
jgi:transcriptional regulator with PAS, ATPase and Fis domain